MLKVDTKSDDDDDSVDIPSSSSSDEKVHKNTNHHKLQTHKLPNKGVANMMTLKMDTQSTGGRRREDNP